jgi:Mnd1 family protein
LTPLTLPEQQFTPPSLKMSKAPKKLGMEEKRQRCLDYFNETADFFQLRDLEKALPKSKGIGIPHNTSFIVTQSVKEVIDSLVDDRLINHEKIGTSNYYWCFPSQSIHSV